MREQRFKPVYGIVGTAQLYESVDLHPTSSSVLDRDRDQILEVMTEGSRPIVGVYALGWETVVMYVGKSTDVVKRVCQHRAEGKIPFEWWKYLPCSNSELDGTERTLITKFKPPFNKLHV